MLIHGFGEDSRIWDDMVQKLSSSYRMIVPDLPGSGRSGELKTGVSMESLASSVHSVADHAKLDRFAMIGHSMGGYVALAFAEQWPERLSKLGLFHSTAFADDEEKKASRFKNAEFIRKHGAAKFLAQSVPKLFSAASARDKKPAIDEIIGRYSDFSPAALVDYTLAMRERPDRTEVLKHFTRPVLFIFGEEDTAVPLEQGLKQSSIPEFSYIYIAARSGHMGMIEEPEFCLKALNDFLAGA